MNGQIQKLSHSARSAVPHSDWAHVKACARKILNSQRNSAEGRFLLGLAENGMERFEQATKAFATAIELDDSRYDAGVELASQYMYVGRYGEAVELLQRFEPLMSKSPLYLDKAAQIYINVGLPDRAWPLLKAANAQQPEADALQARMAECAVFVGKLDVARDIYQQLLKKYPQHQRNHYELSRLARATDSSHVKQMKEVLASNELPPERNIYLYYALGKELEDLERWDEAFEYYQKGGDAARSQSDYDVQADVALIDKVINVCDRQWMEQAVLTSGAAATDKTPVFIVGLPRSGTTLTERILSSHSQVESAGESFFIRDAIKKISRSRSRESMSASIIDAAANADVHPIAGFYFESIDYKLSNCRYFIEKYPENSLYLGFIAKAFPNCRIILQVRNPMDTCFAMYKQSYFRYAYTLDDLGAYYVAYHRLIEHWQELLGDRLIRVSYESMVGDQEVETRRLLERVGLDFEEACLHFEKNKAVSNTASTVQIREKVHSRSVQRWTRYEKHLQSLQEYLERAGVDTRPDPPSRGDD